ncbi:fasciclin domain-containing protein [Flavobacterium sp. FBOR7N2.3]|uniref:Fasciclin domain-containing protein n=1 Tax=Flavobacterium magnesitis TaxID=3138077 RepID=A0ABV4TMS1_9FLAO
MKIVSKIKIVFACVALLSFMVSCNEDDGKPAEPMNTSIAAIASANPDFTTLVTALNRTGLTATLNESGEFTVFAPTNDAFNRFFTSLGNNVTVNNVNVDVLRNVLLNHVIATEIKSSAIPASTYVSTLSPINNTTNAPTISMFVQKSGAVVTLNGGIENAGAVVTTADIDASNGVIHVVNRVIAIPTIKNHAVANPNLSTVTSLLVAQNLAATLDGTDGAPFTVFAPVNTAFDQATLDLYGGLSSGLKTEVLLYHVVGGLNVRSNAIPSGNIPTLQGESFTITGTAINDAGTDVNKNIILTDVQCSNGIVHAIDKVLIPAFD